MLRDEKVYARQPADIEKPRRALCGVADRGGDITRGDILSKGVTGRTDTTVTYTVTVETYDPYSETVTGSEEIPYLYENIDGQWVFTRFQSIY